ncbi:MAG: DNA polymerase I, partial [Nitrospirae bacterium]
ELGEIDLTPRPMDTEALRALFEELEFTRLARELGVEAEGEAQAAERLADPEALAAWLAGEVALTLWIEEEPPEPARLVAIEVATADRAAYALVEEPGPWIEPLRRFLSRRRGRWVGHRLKPQLRWLATAGVAVAVDRFDTQLAAYLLDAGRDPSELAAVARHWLGRRVPSLEEGLGKGKGRKGLAELEPAARATLLAARGRALATLGPRLATELAASGLTPLYEEVEAPLQDVLCAMELAGILVDRGQIEGLAQEMEAELARLEEEIHDLAGEAFNVASPKQLARVLYEGLGLPVIKRTKTGPSTDVSVLEELARRHPLPERVLRYRSVAKLLNTYVRVLPTLIAADGRIHTRFHQTVAATGRLSSSHPNLQNIPVRTEQGRRIRAAFVAPEGWRLLSADYSQIELRLLAHFSGDPDLVHAFNRGEDIHRATAARIFGLEPEQVTEAMRRDAKTINFGILYGMGPYRLARQIDVPQREAKRFIEAYFARYPTVRAFLDRCVAEARETGYATTLLGRRRPLPELHASSRVARANAERMAINTPLQGSAADIIKVAMVRLAERLRAEGLAGRLLLQVHDELLLEVPEAEVEATRALVVEVMQQAARLSVPLVVETGVGRSWEEAH